MIYELTWQRSKHRVATKDGVVMQTTMKGWLIGGPVETLVAWCEDRGIRMTVIGPGTRL